MAEVELQRALDEDAEVFALSALDDAEAALATARVKVTRREYRAALSAALDSTHKSRQALAEAAAAKRSLQVEARAVVASAEESLRRAADAAGARRGSRSDPARAECENLLDRARDFTETFRRHLGQADLVAVNEELPVVRNALAELEGGCAARPRPSPRPLGRRKHSEPRPEAPPGSR